MSGPGDFDGVVLRIAMEGQAAWTIVAPPPTTMNPEIIAPPLPADFAALWATHTHFSSTVIVADTPAASYAEFRRDAEPQAFAHHWMFRPTAPRKVRLTIAAWQEF